MGCIWPLHRSVPCFHELYLPTKLSDIPDWGQRSGFDLVDLKCAEKIFAVIIVLAYFETKFFDMFRNKIFKIPPPPNRALSREATAANCPNGIARKTLRPAKSSWSTFFVFTYLTYKKPSAVPDPADPDPRERVEIQIRIHIYTAYMYKVCSEMKCGH